MNIIFSSMDLFDSHCHLQDKRLGDDISSVIDRAEKAGVKKILCCGSTEEDWDDVARLSEKFPILIPAFGLHPWYIDERSEKWLFKLEEMLVSFPSAAVGEIGLDHVIDRKDKSEQLDVFSAQIELAARYNRPVSIHCRKAWGDLISLFEEKDCVCQEGVIHSYSGSAELIDRLVKFGFFISFSGSVTFERNRKAQESVKRTRLDRLLVESDSPDIPPYGVEGVNEPCNMINVIKRIAEIRGVDPQEIARITYENAERVFVRRSALD